ncbi:MAG: hypothetical protein IT363_01685 [Methanoregulaceae archaeon]|jgi:phosphoribosyl 1,2-cyclic phosphate phosphodiesterase|nr:hypothetical protein [Methanoregulaceae archaeon]
MRIRLMGTGAAEGIPAFYSSTRVSEIARREGGREVRTRSAAVIDDCLKIDFGPDTLHQIHRDVLDARDWCALLFTHSHDDHFCRSELQYMLHPFSTCECMPFSIFGNATIVSRVRERYPEWPIELVETESFRSFAIGPYEVTPIHAYHLLEEDAHNFIIRRDGRTLIYATDTGVWREDTWDFLPNTQANLLVIECGHGRVPSDYFGHLTLDDMYAVIARMREIGAIAPDATIVTTHHSHNGDLTYAEMVEELAPHGIIAGYDGLVLEV